MYFSKHCRFTTVIRSFSFSVKISLEAQTHLNSFSFFFFTPLLCMNSHPHWPRVRSKFNTQHKTHWHRRSKHVYTCMRSTHIGSPALHYGSRTVVPSLQPCQMVVIQFEISRATSDTHCTLTWRLWQRSASYICQPLSQGLRRLFGFTNVNCGETWRSYSDLWNADEVNACYYVSRCAMIDERMEGES